MDEQYRQRQLAHLRAAIAECDKQHSPSEIQAAEEHLGWRSRTKRKLIDSYCDGKTPSIVVRAAFFLLQLRGK